MITIKELQNIPKVIHDRTQVEYEIVDISLQVKIGEGDWFPAVSYRKVSDESWREQVFIRDYATFMKNFSVVKVGE